MYAKFISKTQIEYPPKNKGNIINYNLNIEALKADEYKELIKVEKPDTNRIYHIEYKSNKNDISEIIVYDETQEDANLRELNQAKEIKVQDNDILRDEVLNRGVTYNNILFDSDTDQKVNLLATISKMSDTDTITWFGMDNQPLECTKQDLLNIGGLITQLHTHCWTLNTAYKQAINNASTIEELEGIEIDYEN